MSNQIGAVTATVAAPDEHAAQPGEAVTPSESAPEQTPATASAGDGDNAPADTPKRKHWAHERIDELTRKMRDAQRDAEFWKQRASAPAPSQDDYPDYDDYAAAKTAHLVRSQDAAVRADEAERLAVETFSAREEMARERFPDYDAVARQAGLPITPAMASVIFESEIGPEIAYHLGKNPGEARSIAMMSPERQAVAIGRLEGRLQATANARREPPPPPPQTVGAMAAGTGKLDPAKLSMAEYAAARSAGKI